MEDYGPSIIGEVHFSRQDGGYHVELYDGEGKRGSPGLWRAEARAREAARRLAAKPGRA